MLKCVPPLQVCLLAQTPSRLGAATPQPAAAGQLIHALLLRLVLGSMLLSCVDLVAGQSLWPAAAAGAGVTAAGAGVAAAVHLDAHLVWRAAMAVLACQPYCLLERSASNHFTSTQGLAMLHAQCTVHV